MDKKEAYEALCKEIVEPVETWENLYDYLQDKMKRAVEVPHPARVFDALFSMYSFIVALRELPDEGDIKVLADKMVRTLVYDSREKIGVDLEVATPEEYMKKLQSMRKELVSELDQLFSALSASDPSGPEGNPPETKGGGPTIH